MTIRTIDYPRHGYSDWQVYTNVHQVTKCWIVLHDGTKLPKRICSKVEILDVLDYSFKDESLLRQMEILYGERAYDGSNVFELNGSYKMSCEKWEALEMVNHL